jgi:hypothetical protein
MVCATRWGLHTVTRTSLRRLRQALAAGLAALIGTTACGGSAPKEPVDTPASGNPPAVRFSSHLEVRDEALHISYDLVNESGQDLIVLNRVPAYSKSGVPSDDADAVYVVGEKPDGRVQIAKRAFGMPDTDNMTWTQIPQIFGVRIGQRQSVSEDITVALPLRRHHPYGDDFGDGPIALPDPVKEVRFCLGVVRAAEAPATTPSAGPSPAGNGTVALPHLATSTSVQHLFCSAPRSI